MTFPVRKTAPIEANEGLLADGNARGLKRLLAHSGAKLLAQLLIVVALLTIWEVCSGTLLPRVWVSSPLSMFARLLSWIRDGSLWPHMFATVVAATTGYAIGSAAGVVTGLVLGLSPRIEQVFGPFVIAFYSLPKVALAPLFVISLGIGIESKIALVSITVYFLLLYNTLDGLRDLERGWAEAYRLMGATDREIAWKVLLPGTMPWIFSGLRISVRYAFTAAVFGELIAGNSGIGYLIEKSAGSFNSSGIFAGVFVLVLCSVAATQLIGCMERIALRRRIEGPV